MIDHIKEFEGIDARSLTNGYIQCAIWTTSDEEGKSLLDAGYTEDDLNPASLRAMQLDCLDFIFENRALLADLDPSSCGHDFWLSRNGHGAGFFDRGLGHVGDRLHESAKGYGGVNLCLVDETLELTGDEDIIQKRWPKIMAIIERNQLIDSLGADDSLNRDQAFGL